MKKSLLFLLLTLVCAPAFAQSNDSLVVLFETARDLRLALGDNANLWRQNDRRDANYDGLPELALITEDGQGNPEAFLVLTQLHETALAKTADVQTHNDSLWYFVWPDLIRALGGQEHFVFQGFYPFFDQGNTLKDAVFRGAEGLAIISMIEGSGKNADPPMRFLPADQSAIYDFNEDGLAEVIIRNRDTRTVQVWGRRSTSTATEAEIEAALLHLFQNYPNPFRDATTIGYEVEQAGPVTLTVYDLLGRRVRTLVDEVQPPGSHQTAWDGRDAAGRPVASGTYFYRLRVGEAVSSKQALRIR